jgi:hypothetical protein
MSVRNWSIASRNSGSRAAWWNSSRKPAGSSAAARSSPGMLVSVISSAPVAVMSRPQALSRTAW